MTAYQISEHQTQPTSNSCVSTCVAMILNKPVEEVIKDLHSDYFDTDHCGDYAVVGYLRKHGMWVATMAQDVDSPCFLYTPGYYILTVPSLNYVGGTHAILLTVSKDREGELCWQVLDPAEGKPEKKAYSWSLEYLEKFPETYIKLTSYQIWLLVLDKKEVASRIPKPLEVR